MITVADPQVRDKVAYGELWERISRGEVDGGLAALGDRMAKQFGHAEIQARTFAPLVLVAVLIRDEVAQEVDSDSVHRWLDAFAAWYADEQDLRGYDEKLGWLHAVAHGADAVEAFSRSRHLSRADLVRLLDLVAARVVQPTTYLYAQGEDDRIGSAVVALLLREDLEEADATGWLAQIQTALEAKEPGSYSAQRSNTVRTLNALYVACHRGVRLYDPKGEERAYAQPKHRDAVLEAVARCLRVPHGYLG